MNKNTLLSCFSRDRVCMCDYGREREMKGGRSRIRGRGKKGREKEGN